MHHQLMTAPGRRLAVAIALGALAALALAACGGGSSGVSSSGTHSNAAATAAVGGGSTGTTGSTGSTGTSAKSGTTTPARRRFGALRECLQRNGIKLPAQRGAGRGLFLGGAQLPPGVTRSQLQAAVGKCLGGRLGRPGAVFRNRSRSPQFRQALSRFAACLRQNGVKVPAPNTSGTVPIFSTKGIDTASPQFRAATRKCRGSLTRAFQRRP
jgi:hypothetical protein